MGTTDQAGLIELGIDAGRNLKLINFAVVCVAALASCSGSQTNAPDYFPLTPGYSWEYALTTNYHVDTRYQKKLVRNLRSVQLDEQEVFVQRTQAYDLSYYQKVGRGVTRVATRADDALRLTPDAEQHWVLPSPPELGSHWPLTSRLRLVEAKTFAMQDRLAPVTFEVDLTYSIDSLDAETTVPAGRFAHCLLVRAVGQTQVPVNRGNGRALIEVEHRDWYAPQVGLVRSERWERSDSVFLHEGRYVLELLNYSH